MGKKSKKLKTPPKQKIAKKRSTKHVQLLSLKFTVSGGLVDEVNTGRRKILV